MWLYLGIFISLVLSYHLFNRSTYTVLKEIHRSGLRICVVWARQVITNWLSIKFIEIHHRYYIIHYPYGVTWYKIIVPRRRGPCTIHSITDADGNDVKDAIFAFMGPGHSFHGIRVTPRMLGYETLTFNDTVFTDTDVITI